MKNLIYKYFLKKINNEFYLKKINKIEKEIMNRVQSLDYKNEYWYNDKFEKFVFEFDNLMDGFFNDYYYLYLNKYKKNGKKSILYWVNNTTTHLDLGFRFNVNNDKLKYLLVDKRDMDYSEFVLLLNNYFKENSIIMGKIIEDELNNELQNIILFDFATHQIKRGFRTINYTSLQVGYEMMYNMDKRKSCNKKSIQNEFDNFIETGKID